ncbi:MAG: gliding motility-associated C-terminal domain-containing protein [Flavobacteriales bacterium]|nr:gliding motility-associated C-terminal domain-containing protein [Flavobacteriales bacterium]MBP9079781.1 gliding motility-associated C-terminal domain-containing protein [Flavobacteriales bacterium]
MKSLKLIHSCAAALLSAGLHAQLPSKCLEIESILVDACISATDCPASTEGMNEMVRFITGPAPIALGDLQFEFFSSSFLGIAQNASTAALTSQLNATMQGCGFLLEPPAGVIPPGSEVLFVTSTAMCAQANSFTALYDTLYIIFQVPGNSQGHFKNNDLSGQPITTVPGPVLNRWLRMSVTGTGCGDTATYDAGQLTNIHGTYGGTSAENDGATVDLSWPGTPMASYMNHGCMAAFEPTVPEVISGGGPVACGDSAALSGSITGDYVSAYWHGGGGGFSNPTALATHYIPGGGDNGNVQLSFCAVLACGDTICTQVAVATGATPQVGISGDTTLCGNFATTVLTASGADTYLWSTGATGPSIVAAISGPTSYWVVGTTSCGTDTAFIAPGWMNHTTYYQNVSCAGAADGTLALQGNHGELPYSYTWSTGSTDPMISGLAPGSYSYTITDADGCSQSGSYFITEPPVLTATIAADTTICPGGYAVLLAQGAGGSPAYTYTWSPEGPLASPSETTVYTVVVTDTHGCTAGPLQMTVNVGGVPAVFTVSDTLGCLPHCITFTAGQTDGATYTWTLGDGSTGTGAVLEHCYATAGSFTVNLTVDPGNGCTSSSTLTDLVQVQAPPTAEFNFTPDGSSPQVQFNDQSTGATTWLWLFGDLAGSTSSSPSPLFAFPGEGCYPVNLVAMNDAGCVDSTTAQVCISTTDSLLIPNLFTPNNDGVNEVFRVTGGNLAALDVQVFNRWGQEVARLERVNQVWDGRTMAGEELSAGTYFYTLQAVGKDARHYDLNGTVILVR